MMLVVQVACITVAAICVGYGFLYFILKGIK